MANMLVLVGILGVGMAAMRDGSESAARAAFTIMIAGLAVGLLGAVVLRGSPPWTGFAMFGWGYAALAFVPVSQPAFQPLMLTTPLLDLVIEWLYGIPPQPEVPSYRQSRNGPGDDQRLPLTAEEMRKENEFQIQWNAHWAGYGEFEPRIKAAHTIGNSILALTYGFVGAILGRFLASRQTSRGLSSDPESGTETSPLTS
jgi:hypothetical protein